jgi:hypothetical protein
MDFFQCAYCNKKYKTQKKLVQHENEKCEGKKNARNYDIDPKSKSEKLINCHVPGCRKKFKKEDSLKTHIETNHFYNTRGNNHFEFDSETKIKIYEIASRYVRTIHLSVEDQLKALLPQLDNPSEEDMTRIAIAQKEFAEKLFNLNFFIECDWEKVMKDFQCFIRMGLPYYDTNFCPSLPIDFLWHALMQDRALYKEICKKSCKQIIPHCEKERTKEEDEKRYQYFLKVFRERFSRNPYEPEIHVGKEIDISKISERFVKLAKKERQKIIKQEEKRKQEKEASEKEEEAKKVIMKNFSENAGVNCKEWYSYNLHYLPGYKKGLTGKELEKYAANEIDAERRSRVFSSSC